MIVGVVILNLRVEMGHVMALKIVQLAQMIVDHVLQPNIVGIMSVIMEKHVIHVGRIVQNARKSVVMVSVRVQKVV
jgi:hypothetical protein